MPSSGETFAERAGARRTSTGEAGHERRELQGRLRPAAQAHALKPGQSGNPSGRPKGAPTCGR